MKAEVRIIDARPDWITGFAANGDRADALEEQFHEWLAVESDAGDRVHAMGLEAFSGEATRHIFVGRRHDGVLIRAGSSAADTALDLALPLVDHLSRLDYCVTATVADQTYDPSAELWQLGQADDPEQPRLPTITQTRQRWGGSTTYVGKRTSAIVARVYNKTQESQGLYPANSWRWEIELKRHASEQEHVQLKVDPSRADLAASLVGSQFARWKIPIPWTSSTEVELWRSPPRERDIDRSVKWLHDQVAKSAQLVAKTYGRERLFEILGLDEDSVTGA